MLIALFCCFPFTVFQSHFFISYLFSRRSANRKNCNIVHCLRCHKPQEILPVHLARVCMRTGSTPEERAEEFRKARASSREWILNSRTWDYRHLCEILPDTHSRAAMVKELLRRGFFITNQPQESDTAPDPDSDSDTTDRDPPSTQTSSVRIKMKEAGLYGKFPADAKLLVDFKKHLMKSLRVSHWQTEVRSLHPIHCTRFPYRFAINPINHGNGCWEDISPTDRV